MNRSVAALAVVFLASGCSTMSGAVQDEVLAHYRSTENYGRLVIRADESISRSALSGQFIELVNTYASARGIELTDRDGFSEGDSLIVFSLGEQGRYRVALTRRGVVRDTLALDRLDEKTAELVVDEMLLLWHPPTSGQRERKPVPLSMLMPTSYEPTTYNPFANLFGDAGNDNLNAGWQAWQPVESLNPEFSWERFPRPWDIPEGMGADDFTNVRYEFLMPRHAHVTDLEEPSYRLESPLEHCERARWTVRAHFELNGVPRMTEWGGAYSIMSRSYWGPWIRRRGGEISIPLFGEPQMRNVDVHNFMYSVRAPDSPFAEGCGN